jgi:hypothetical protein
MKSRARRAGLVIPLGLFVLLLGGLCTGGPRAASAEASEQVIFSGVGTSSAGPVGFWIWCQDEGNGPYAGECHGAMYVYAQHLTTGVNGDISELSEGLYEMQVVSNQGPGVLQATLRNPDEAEKGPHNTVTFTVTTAQGTLMGSSDNAVVVVTGPPENHSPTAKSVATLSTLWKLFSSLK